MHKTKKKNQTHTQKPSYTLHSERVNIVYILWVPHSQPFYCSLNQFHRTCIQTHLVLVSSCNTPIVLLRPVLKASRWNDVLVSKNQSSNLSGTKYDTLTKTPLNGVRERNCYVQSILFIQKIPLLCWSGADGSLGGNIGISRTNFSFWSNRQTGLLHDS